MKRNKVFLRTKNLINSRKFDYFDFFKYCNKRLYNIVFALGENFCRFLIRLLFILPVLRGSFTSKFFSPSLKFNSLKKFKNK